jgi:DNA-binding transcriptional ArsR family regulator
MSWNIDLSLNTDYQRFEAWLDRYRLSTTPFLVDLEGGKTLHVTSAPTFDVERQGLRHHRIDASIGKPSLTAPEAIELTWGFSVIELALFEPARERLRVRIECKHHAVFEYYVNLLGAITQVYPEAGNDVLHYMKKFAPAEEGSEVGEAETDKGQREPSGSARPSITIADPQGGTITGYRNEQGQTFLTGTINPGYEPAIARHLATKPYEAASQTFGELTENPDNPGARGGAGELPDNIRMTDIDVLIFDVATARELYRDFSDDRAREILRAIPEVSKALRRTQRLKAQMIASHVYVSLSSVSNHFRVLYTMGLRTVEGIPLPYKPRKSTK